MPHFKTLQILVLIFLSPITTTNTPVGKTNSAKHQRTGTFRNCCRRDACTTQPTRNKSVLALPRVRASTGEVAAPTARVKRDASALCIGLARLFACLGRGNFFWRLGKVRLKVAFQVGCDVNPSGLGRCGTYKCWFDNASTARNERVYQMIAVKNICSNRRKYMLTRNPKIHGTPQNLCLCLQSKKLKQLFL